MRETAIWRGVIFQAMADALFGPADVRGAAHERVRQECDRWLTRGGRDFEIVCACAGVEPEWVRREYTSGKMAARISTQRGRNRLEAVE